MTNYILYALIAVGSLLLVFSLVDIKSILTNLTKRQKSSSPEIVKKEVTFLEIVGLWYQLKTKCDYMGLAVASEKLDEVFPLLNDVVEHEEKTI